MTSATPPAEEARAMLDRQTFLAGAVAVLAASLVALLFIASYAGALHDPRPHDVPIAVAAQVPAQAAQRLDATSAFAVRRVASPAAAQREVDQGKAYGSIVATGRGRLQLTTSTASSAAVADLLRQRLVPALRQQGAQVSVRAVHPLAKADARGLAGFYTVVGWVVAGYLGATLFGLAFGTHPGRRGTVLRLGGLLALGVVVGLGGALIADAIAGWDQGLAKIALVGALTAMAVGAATIAFQSALGIAGTGVAILVFVVLGNPSAGGPYPAELLPGLWRTVGPLLPPGAATSAVRHAAYFPDASMAGPLLVLLAWLVGGTAVALLLGRRARPMSENELAASLGGAAGA